MKCKTHSTEFNASLTLSMPKNALLVRFLSKNGFVETLSSAEKFILRTFASSESA